MERAAHDGSALPLRPRLHLVLLCTDSASLDLCTAARVFKHCLTWQPSAGQTVAVAPPSPVVSASAGARKPAKRDATTRARRRSSAGSGGHTGAAQPPTGAAAAGASTTEAQLLCASVQAYVQRLQRAAAVRDGALTLAAAEMAERGAGASAADADADDLAGDAGDHTTPLEKPPADGARRAGGSARVAKDSVKGKRSLTSEALLRQSSSVADVSAHAAEEARRRDRYVRDVLPDCERALIPNATVSAADGEEAAPLVPVFFLYRLDGQEEILRRLARVHAVATGDRRASAQFGGDGARGPEDDGSADPSVLIEEALWRTLEPVLRAEASKPADGGRTAMDVVVVWAVASPALLRVCAARSPVTETRAAVDSQQQQPQRRLHPRLVLLLDDGASKAGSELVTQPLTAEAATLDAAAAAFLPASLLTEEERLGSAAGTSGGRGGSGGLASDGGPARVSSKGVGEKKSEHGKSAAAAPVGAAGGSSGSSTSGGLGPSALAAMLDDPSSYGYYAVSRTAAQVDEVLYGSGDVASPPTRPKSSASSTAGGGAAAVTAAPLAATTLAPQTFAEFAARERRYGLQRTFLERMREEAFPASAQSRFTVEVGQIQTGAVPRGDNGAPKAAAHTREGLLCRVIMSPRSALPREVGPKGAVLTACAASPLEALLVDQQQQENLTCPSLSEFASFLLQRAFEQQQQCTSRAAGEGAAAAAAGGRSAASRRVVAILPAPEKTSKDPTAGAAVPAGSDAAEQTLSGIVAAHRARCPVPYTALDALAAEPAWYVDHMRVKPSVAGGSGDLADDAAWQYRCWAQLQPLLASVGQTVSAYGEWCASRQMAVAPAAVAAADDVEEEHCLSVRALHQRTMEGLRATPRQAALDTRTATALYSREKTIAGTFNVIAGTHALVSQACVNISRQRRLQPFVLTQKTRLPASLALGATAAAPVAPAGAPIGGDLAGGTTSVLAVAPACSRKSVAADSAAQRQPDAPSRGSSSRGRPNVDPDGPSTVMPRDPAPEGGTVEGNSDGAANEAVVSPTSGAFVRPADHTDDRARPLPFPQEVQWLLQAYVRQGLGQLPSHENTQPGAATAAWRQRVRELEGEQRGGGNIAEAFAEEDERLEQFVLDRTAVDATAALAEYLDARLPAAQAVGHRKAWSLSEVQEMLYRCLHSGAGAVGSGESNSAADAGGRADAALQALITRGLTARERDHALQQMLLVALADAGGLLVPERDLHLSSAATRTRRTFLCPATEVASAHVAAAVEAPDGSSGGALAEDAWCSVEEHLSPVAVAARASALLARFGAHHGALLTLCLRGDAAEEDETPRASDDDSDGFSDATGGAAAAPPPPTFLRSKNAENVYPQRRVRQLWVCGIRTPPERRRRLLWLHPWSGVLSLPQYTACTRWLQSSSSSSSSGPSRSTGGSHSAGDGAAMTRQHHGASNGTAVVPPAIRTVPSEIAQTLLRAYVERASMTPPAATAAAALAAPSDLASSRSPLRLFAESRQSIFPFAPATVELTTTVRSRTCQYTHQQEFIAALHYNAAETLCADTREPRGHRHLTVRFDDGLTLSVGIASSPAGPAGAPKAVPAAHGSAACTRQDASSPAGQHARRLLAGLPSAPWRTPVNEDGAVRMPPVSSSVPAGSATGGGSRPVGAADPRTAGPCGRENSSSSSATVSLDVRVSTNNFVLACDYPRAGRPASPQLSMFYYGSGSSSAVSAAGASTTTAALLPQPELLRCVHVLRGANSALATSMEVEVQREVCTRVGAVTRRFRSGVVQTLYANGAVLTRFPGTEPGRTPRVVETLCTAAGAMYARASPDAHAPASSPGGASHGFVRLTVTVGAVAQPDAAHGCCVRSREDGVCVAYYLLGSAEDVELSAGAGAATASTAASAAAAAAAVAALTRRYGGSTCRRPSPRQLYSEQQQGPLAGPAADAPLSGQSRFVASLKAKVHVPLDAAPHAAPAAAATADGVTGRQHEGAAAKDDDDSDDGELPENVARVVLHADGTTITTLPVSGTGDGLSTLQGTSVRVLAALLEEVRLVETKAAALAYPDGAPHGCRKKAGQAASRAAEAVPPTRVRWCVESARMPRLFVLARNQSEDCGAGLTSTALSTGEPAEASVPTRGGVAAAVQSALASSLGAAVAPFYVSFGDGSGLLRQAQWRQSSTDAASGEWQWTTVFSRPTHTTVRLFHHQALAVVEPADVLERAHRPRGSPAAAVPPHTLAVGEGFAVFDLALGGLRFVDLRQHITLVEHMFSAEKDVAATISDDPVPWEQLLRELVSPSYSPHRAARGPVAQRSSAAGERDDTQDGDGTAAEPLLSRLRALGESFITRNGLLRPDSLRRLVRSRQQLLAASATARAPLGIRPLLFVRLANEEMLQFSGEDQLSAAVRAATAECAARAVAVDGVVRRPLLRTVGSALAPSSAGSGACDNDRSGVEQLFLYVPGGAADGDSSTVLDPVSGWGVGTSRTRCAARQQSLLVAFHSAASPSAFQAARADGDDASPSATALRCLLQTGSVQQGQTSFWLPRTMQPPQEPSSACRAAAARGVLPAGAPGTLVRVLHRLESLSPAVHRLLLESTVRRRQRLRDMGAYHAMVTTQPTTAAGAARALAVARGTYKSPDNATAKDAPLPESADGGTTADAQEEAVLEAAVRSAAHAEQLRLQQLYRSLKPRSHTVTPTAAAKDSR